MNKRNGKYCWTNTLLVTVIIGLLLYVLKTVNTYGKLSKNIFIAVNAIFLLLTLLLLVLTVKANFSKKRAFKRFFTGVLAISLMGSGYLFYLVTVVNSTVKEVVTQESLIEYSASFVVRKSTYTDVDDLKDKTIGMIESKEFIEGHVLPIAELEKLEYEDVKVKNYTSYPLLINALIKKEVDFISLPKDYESLFLTDETVSELIPQIEAVHTFSGKYDNPSIMSGSGINVTEVPFTMLIMGNDGGRTDSLMLASVNPVSMQITLTSIARDSYVPIACYPNQNRDKINHARNISRDCTIKTVENLLDVSVDFFVEISFQGLVDLVDALGTIPINSPGAFNGNVVRDGEVVGGVHIPEGLSDLNGDQVLAFVRERKSFAGGDFQRQENQQQAISSLISTIAETRDVNTLLNIVKAAGKNLDTNFSITQLIDLMNLALNRMEATFLNSSDIVTIYGSRITGHSAMIFSPDYGFDLYYYVPYKGSIIDARNLIAMNMREDGVLEIPKGFNYSAKDEYTPPTFTKEIYNERVDESIFSNAPQRPSDDEGDDSDNVVLEEMKGWTLERADKYLSDLGFEYTINETFEEVTEDQSKIGVTVVASSTGGIEMNETNNVIRLNVIKYIAEKTEEPVIDEIFIKEELKGQNKDNTVKYLNSLGLDKYGYSYSFSGPIEEATGDKSLDGLVLVKTNTFNFVFNKENPKLNLQLIKYVYDPELDVPNSGDDN